MQTSPHFDRPTPDERLPSIARQQFVELDTRQNDGYTISLEWSRETGTTRIVVGDIRTTTQLVFPVAAANAGDAFRHPFRYAP
ncbi:MAG TPA: hypothetical protein VFW09_11320 [Solirubrobacteraceae bacterium]|nr:hypothetical protein [Solirubrobacteraceae bacterium]